MRTSRWLASCPSLAVSGRIYSDSGAILVCKKKSEKWIVISTAAAVAVAFIAGIMVFRDRSTVAVTQAAQNNNEALLRAHSPVYGNLEAKVTIVEFFDPACEICRIFYPIVKRMVNSSFGQIRVVVRYARLHKGLDTAIKILEGVRKQVKYWEVVKKRLPTSRNGLRTAIHNLN